MIFLTDIIQYLLSAFHYGSIAKNSDYPQKIAKCNFRDNLPKKVWKPDLLLKALPDN